MYLDAFSSSEGSEHIHHYIGNAQCRCPAPTATTLERLPHHSTRQTPPHPTRTHANRPATQSRQNPANNHSSNPHRHQPPQVGPPQPGTQHQHCTSPAYTPVSRECPSISPNATQTTDHGPRAPIPHKDHDNISGPTTPLHVASWGLAPPS
jgi:hypothetical protein